MSAERTQTWSAKKRLSVAGPITSPPKRKCVTGNPTNGEYDPIFIPTTVAQKPSWSHRRAYPVNAMVGVRSNSVTPSTQLTSRGAL